MILRLHPFLSRFTSMRFFAPEDGGGAGAAVADPPAADADTANDDIMSFAAPDINEALTEVTGKPAATPPAKDEKKPVADKKPDPTPEKKTEPQKEPPARQLRAELETTKTERDQLKGELDTLKKKLDAGDPRIAEKEKELTDAKKKIADYEQRTIRESDAVREPLKKLDEAYNKESGKFFRNVQEMDQPTINSLVREYHQLPFGKPEYKEARAAFEKKVNERLGGDEEKEHRKLGTTLDFIERSRDFAIERADTEQEVNSKADKLYRDGQLSEFTTKRQNVMSLLEKAKEFPKDKETTDPFHPDVVLPKFIEAFGDAFKDIDETIDVFVEKLFVGNPPRSAEDYVGMSPQQIAESQAVEASKLQEIQAQGPRVVRNGLRALRAFPTLYKDWLRLREKLKENTDSQPPDPTKGSDSTPGADDDLKNFKAPAIPSFGA